MTHRAANPAHHQQGGSNMSNYRWLLIALLLITGSAHAAPPYTTQLLTNNGGLGVAAQNEWLLVGDPDESVCSVFVYQLDYSTMLYGDGADPVTAGSPFQTITAPEAGGNCSAAGNRGFGEVVTVDGDIMLVGAPLAKGQVSITDFPALSAAAGTVFIYEYNGTSWVPAEVDSLELVFGRAADLLAADGSEFGSALSLDGDLIAVGARFDGEKNGPTTGKVHLYRWSRNGDGDLEVTALATTPEVAGENDGDAFGSAVTVWVEDTASGTGMEQVLVGAPGNVPEEVNAGIGATYLYTLTGDDAGTAEKIIATTFAEPAVGLGTEVSLGADLGLMSGSSAYPLERVDGSIQPKFQYTRSAGGDVSQSDGVSAFGINGEGVDIYPDVLNDAVDADQRNNYHLEITLTGAASGTGEDIRLYKDFVAVNDNPNDRVQVLHFPTNYGGKLLANEWDLVTAPGNLPAGTTVEQAFNADIFPGACPPTPCGVLGDYGVNWEVWGQDWVGDQDYTIPQTTLRYLGTDLVQAGKGYWIKADGSKKPGQPVYWNVSKESSTSPEAYKLSLTTDNPFSPGSSLPTGVGAYYQLDLPDNIDDPVVDADVMLGNPLGRAFKWSDVGVILSDGTTPVTVPVSELGGSSYPDNTLTAYRYVPDPDEGQLYQVVSSTPGLDDVIPVNEGFFVVVKQPEQNPGLTFDKLLIPYNK
jgi:FG-GAP repeat